MTYVMIPETMPGCLGTSILPGSIWRMTSRSCQNKNSQRHGGRLEWQTSCWSWGHLIIQTDGVRSRQDEDRYEEGTCGCLWISVFGIKITTALPSLWL